MIDKDRALFHAGEGALGSARHLAEIVIITDAGKDEILVFGSFAFARTLAVQFLGFGLAVAVLLDVTLIRLVIVPAFMQLAGRWNWWPVVTPVSRRPTGFPSRMTAQRK